MSWNLEYSSRAYDFIQKHRIHEKIKETINIYIQRINGSNINIDIKKLKGEWTGYHRIRKGKIRIILKTDINNKTIYIDVIDFRGNIYK